MVVILNSKYEILENIGEGTFGRVFLGKHIKKNNNVAIKIQHKNFPNILKYEAKIYKYIKDISGIPIMYNYGIDQGFNYLIMEYINKTIEECNLKGKKIIRFLIQAINIIEKVHNRGVLHRDIKPDNFLIKGETDELYLIDFGLSKIYFDKNNNHIEERRERKLIGTAKYSSINIHKGIEGSRRDDMESLCYTFIMILTKSLPWENIFHKEYKEILQKKEGCLKWMYNLPGEFITMLLYCRKLKYNEKPNYTYLKNLFSNLLNNI